MFNNNNYNNNNNNNNNNDKTQNKRFKTIDDYAGVLAVCCKIIADTGTITNYLINIEDYAGGTTILLDKDGNPMLSQIKL